MDRRWVGALVFVLACGPARTEPPPMGAPRAAGGGECDAACAHLLGCFGQDTAEQRASCNADCAQRAAQPGELAAIRSATCQQLAAALGGGQGGQGGYDFGAASQVGAPPSSGGCSADCTGCVGDGTSCYHGTGLACDACCCAPGGPSPTWE